MRTRIKLLGASVVGPSHARQGEPNQDALATVATDGYTLAIICDGMGSAKYGKFGAESAVESVSLAAKIWVEAQANGVDRLLRLIHQIWNIKVEGYGGRESATTCLFALVRADGTGMLAQLGDGLILAKLAKQGIIHLSEPKQGFANETQGLGTVSDLKNWQVATFEGFSDGDCILLCTDGISEDISAGQELGFMEFIKGKYGERWRWWAEKALSRDLLHWPTDMHHDDKTICLLWK